MKLYYDLHIHSSLSPCGDDDMTPNNIVHMAMLKELNMIAVTDHNSARNLPAVKKVAEECGILLIPGIEVTTAEEIHLLTYFETVEETMDFGEYIYDSLPDISNRPEIFGEQRIMDETDAVTGHLDKLLLTASCHSIDALCREVSAPGRGSGSRPCQPGVQLDFDEPGLYSCGSGIFVAGGGGGISIAGSEPGGIPGIVFLGCALYHGYCRKAELFELRCKFCRGFGKDKDNSLNGMRERRSDI